MLRPKIAKTCFLLRRNAIAMIQRMPSALVALSFTAVLVATANSATRAQEVLDAAIGRTISVVQRVGNIGITPDGKIVAVVTHDQTVMFFETDTGKQLGETPRLTFNSGNGLHLEFSPDSNLVACRDGWNSTIRIWSTKTGKEHTTVQVGTASPRRFIFAPDSASLLVASGDEAVLWSLATKAPIKTLHREEDPYHDDIYGLLFLPDGKSVVTGGGAFDKTARIWDLGAEKEVQAFGNHQQAVSQLACSPDGTRLVTLSSSEARLFDLRDGKELKRTTVRHRGRIRFTADSEFVVISEGDGPQEFLDSQTLEGFTFGQIVERKHLLADGVEKPLPEHAVAFSEDGRWVVFAQGSRKATHFSLLSGLSRRIGTLPITATCGHGFQLSFSRNGKKLVLKRADDEIAVLNCEAIAEAVAKEAAARAEAQRLAQIERDKIAAKEAEEMRLRQAEAERLAALKRERAAKEAEITRARRAEEERLAALERERAAEEERLAAIERRRAADEALAERDRMAKEAEAMRAKQAEEERLAATQANQAVIAGTDTPTTSGEEPKDLYGTVELLGTLRGGTKEETYASLRSQTGKQYFDSAYKQTGKDGSERYLGRLDDHFYEKYLDPFGNPQYREVLLTDAERAQLHRVDPEVRKPAPAAQAVAQQSLDAADRKTATSAGASYEDRSGEWPAPKGQERDVADAADRLMAALLGETSDHYKEFGYKDVALGTTFLEITKRTPLAVRLRSPSFLFVDERTGNYYIFDTKDRLVCHAHRYRGGPDDYLDQLIEKFGKTTRPTTTRDHSGPQGQFRKVHTNVDYTFPKVLVRVVFEEMVYNDGRQTKDTYVFVLDRRWAEGILRRAAVAKVQAAAWLNEVAQSVGRGTFDPEGVSVVPGTRTEVLGEEGGVRLIDIEREKRMAAQWGARSTKMATCAGVRFYPGKPAAVFFDCFRCSATRCGEIVKEQPADGEGSLLIAESVQSMPILSDFLVDLNQMLLEVHFPPDSNEVSRMRQPDGLIVDEWLEWTSTNDEQRKWQVICDLRQVMRVELLRRKRL